MRAKRTEVGVCAVAAAIQSSQAIIRIANQEQQDLRGLWPGLPGLRHSLPPLPTAPVPGQPPHQADRLEWAACGRCRPRRRRLDGCFGRRVDGSLRICSWRGGEKQEGYNSGADAGILACAGPEAPVSCGLDRGAWLTAAREAAGIHHDSDLARKADTLTSSGRSLIAGFRAGRRPSWKYVDGLARALRVAPEEVAEHLWGERPGELCVCGCGGVMVPPGDPDAHKLLVELVCQGCGAPRSYRQGVEHFPHCRPCSQKRVIRFGRRSSLGSDHPAAPVLRLALERKGLTLQEAEERAGFAQGTVARWLSGRRGRPGVLRDTLERLVSVLEAPEVFDVIPWRWRRWSLTCTSCDSVYHYQPGQFRSRLTRGRHAEAVIHEATGGGTFVCRRCKQREAGKRSPVGRKIAILRKRGGRTALRARVLKLRARQTPRQLAENLAKAHAANRGRVQTEEERLRRSWAGIAPRPAGKLGLCRVCDLLTHTYEPTRPAETHRDCLSKYRHQYQRVFGRPLYPPRRMGRRLSHEELADSFEIAVRSLLKGEHIGERDGSGLAARFDLDKKSCLRRIDALITRLPQDGRGGRQLACWADALREAYLRRRGTAL